jgi:hypothetical protein
MKRIFAAAIVAACWFALPSTSQAITIGPTCGTCGGHNTTFNITATVVNNTTHVYDFQIVATYGATLDYKYITAVGIQPPGAVENFVSVSGPDGQTWSAILGTLNNGGCATNPGEAFACSNGTPNGASSPGPDTWHLVLDLDQAFDVTNFTLSFKARFVDANGNFVGPLVSEEGSTSGGTTSPTTPTGTTSPTTPTVPEPTSLVLLGSGLLAVGRQVRKHLTARAA